MIGARAGFSVSVGATRRIPPAVQCPTSRRAVPPEPGFAPPPAGARSALNRTAGSRVKPLDVMKTLFATGAAALVAGVFFATGCVVHERRVVYAPPPPGAVQPAEVVVTAPPPPPPTEVVIPSPGPAYVWVPGAWEWQGRWVWTGGHWILRPHPHAVWVGPRVVVRGRSHVWIRGYWR